MNTDPQPVSVSILDKEYLVACDEDEREELVATARYLNKRMKEIRDSGKVVGLDRVAVMTALNISHELLQNTDLKDDYAQTVVQKLKSMRERVESVLAGSKQLEF